MVELSLQRAFAMMPGHWVASLNSGREGIMTAVAVLTARLDYDVIYVSSNAPHGEISAALREKGAPLSRVYYADAASMQAGGAKVDRAEVIYVNSIENLTDLSVAIDALAPHLQARKKAIVVDSLEKMLEFHSPDATVKFANFLALKSRAMGFSCLFLSSDPKAAGVVEGVCDSVIRL